MHESQPERQSLRQLVRQRRKNLSPAEQQAAAQQLLAQFKQHPEILAAKQVFPGATVERVRTRVTDPLDAVPDSKVPIDDTMPW
jgi:hypothetical protein